MKIKKDEKKLKKFQPQVKGKHPEFSFEEVKKELIKSLELSDLEKSDDIIDSVRDMEMIDLQAIQPQLQTSEVSGVTREAVELRDAENDRFKETYRYDLKKWDSRVDALRNNTHKQRAKILKFCYEEMEDKLEREPDFETTLYRNPEL